MKIKVSNTDAKAPSDLPGRPMPPLIVGLIACILLFLSKMSDMTLLTNVQFLLRTVAILSFSLAAIQWFVNFRAKRR